MNRTKRARRAAGAKRTGRVLKKLELGGIKRENELKLQRQEGWGEAEMKPESDRGASEKRDGGRPAGTITNGSDWREEQIGEGQIGKGTEQEGEKELQQLDLGARPLAAT